MRMAAPDHLIDEETELELDTDPEEADSEEEQADQDDDMDPDVEQEIKKVIVEEEDAPKSKTQSLPDQLIHQKLHPDDLFDDGSI